MEQGLLGFATLLIGLTVGKLPVELMVAQPVARVRLVLDGREVATLDAPPWRTQIDFGPSPAPHRLEAFGLDGTAPRSRARCSGSTCRGPRPSSIWCSSGTPRRPCAAARLAWTTARPVAPAAVRAVLDGEPAPRRRARAGSCSRPTPARGATSSGSRSTSRAASRRRRSSPSAASSPRPPRRRSPRSRSRSCAGAIPSRSGGACLARTAQARCALPRSRRGARRVVVVIDGERHRAAPQGGAGKRVAAANAHDRVAAWGDIPSSCSWLARPLRSGDDEVLVFEPTAGQRSCATARAPGCSPSAPARAPARRTSSAYVLRTDLGRRVGGRAGADERSGECRAGGRRRGAPPGRSARSSATPNPASGDLGAAGARGFLERLDVPLRVWSPVAAVAATRAGRGGDGYRTSRPASCSDAPGTRLAEALGPPARGLGRGPAPAARGRGGVAAARSREVTPSYDGGVGSVPSFRRCRITAARTPT